MSETEYATKEDIKSLKREIGLLKKIIADRLFDEEELSEEELKKIKRLLKKSKEEKLISIEEI